MRLGVGWVLPVCVFPVLCGGFSAVISAEPVLTALMLAEKNPPVLEIAVEDAAWCVWENWLLRWRIWDLSRVEQVYVNSRGFVLREWEHGVYSNEDGAFNITSSTWFLFLLFLFSLCGRKVFISTPVVSLAMKRCDQGVWMCFSVSQYWCGFLFLWNGL